MNVSCFAASHLSSLMIALGRHSMLRTRCGAPCAVRWRKGSGGALRPKIRGAAWRVPVLPREMCRRPLSARSSGSLSLGSGGPIRHPYLFQRRQRETANMMMGSVIGSGWASASSHVTRTAHLHLGINREPNYGYSFQGNVGPNEHYDPFFQGTNSIQPVGPEVPDIDFLGEPIFSYRASAGSLFGPLAGAAPVEQSMNLPSPPVHAMVHAASNLYSSSGLLPAEQVAFQAEGSGMVNIQLPNVGEVVVALSVDVQPGDVIDGPEYIMSDGEESIEVLSG
ncbi:hypothetical protein BT93_H2533 [Corymbia citriodora subsp. variegata]|nr:hypothetical protein BT93_H2533 [Corymbia citriodora subsp. variegata]